MLIAAFDSTAVTASVAVAEVTDEGLKTYSVFSTKNKLTHSENLMPMLEAVLKIYGASVNDIGLFAVNVGPGSFTGVRIGTATVKGLAFEKGIPCAGVSTLWSLAANCGDGTVCALMDARRNQFYYAFFRDGKRITPDGVAGIEEISAFLDSEKECTLCGDGMELFASLYTGGCKLKKAPPVAADQNALSVALCGYEIFCAKQAVPPEKLQPVYLRMPQAEREKLEREKAQKENKK